MAWFKKMFKGKEEPENDAHSPQSDKGQDTAIKAEDADEVLPEDNRSLLTQLIAKNGLSMGMDLSKVTLPTFILEPRSLLEKLGDTVIHPEEFAKIPKAATPEDRLVAVVRWYFSAYHKRPKGVKKPFNPVLGETFKAKFQSADEASSINWTAEQVSHHPPVSAFYANDDANTIVMMGHFAPKSRFLGNSAASIGDGGFRIFLPEHNETYCLTWPTVYVRGVLFGTLLMEIGGPVNIRCPNTGLHADIEFVTKGYFTGSHNCVTGSLYRSAQPGVKGAPKDVLYTIDGNWHKQVNIKSAAGGDATVLFDFNESVSPMGTCSVSEEELQDTNSSRTLWAEVAAAVSTNQQEDATKHKTAIEEHQRTLRAQRKEKGEVWRPKLFASSIAGEGDEEKDQEFLAPGAVKFPSLE